MPVTNNKGSDKFKSRVKLEKAGFCKVKPMWTVSSRNPKIVTNDCQYCISFLKWVQFLRFTDIV